MTPRPRKVHVESDRRRYLGYDRGFAVVMLCGAGWGEPLDSTPTPEDATCKRCLSIAAGPKPKIEHGPIHMSRTPSKLDRAPPDRGAHNDEVLAEFGLKPEEIAGLRASGTI